MLQIDYNCIISKHTGSLKVQKQQCNLTYWYDLKTQPSHLPHLLLEEKRLSNVGLKLSPGALRWVLSQQGVEQVLGKKIGTHMDGKLGQKLGHICVLSEQFM